MKMNAGVWVGIIGGLLGLVVGIAAVLTTAGSAGIYIALGMMAIFGGMFFLFYKLFFGPMINTARLNKTGIPGKGLIKEVRDTGITINNSPQVKLVMDIKNYLGQTYSTTIRTLVSRLNPNSYQPGMTVPVKIDPKNENNVIIDFSEEKAGKSTKPQHAVDMGMSIADVELLQKNLVQEQQASEAIKLTGKDARAIVRNYTWLGVYLNGNNPYVEIEVEVLPEGAPAFTAKVKGVVKDSSVPRYQPGQEIKVKYDPYDASKVAIDHS